MLLGPGRIVHGGGPGVLLRCFCGEVVAWNQPPPEVQPPTSTTELAASSAGG